jgi:hypothetical protein
VFAHVSQLRVKRSAERFAERIRSVIGMASECLGGLRAEPRALFAVTPVGPRQLGSRSAVTQGLEPRGGFR